ncbi:MULTISPECIES: hypothetical protein [Streptomyces]|uniref:Uncharacterized protein n=1 Tax=Streptomyces fradiae ATCC 10745 = DSM 40063 TaxID=1319510 RepID=A0A1Y2NQK3_STRFR|nr:MULTISPECIES: hypothetical protein [Streptomyces]KAF0650304.1 hypothetical protein K701_09115 [Streptomyces fradiae ATCC 10745 = DSM 40063]OSY49228.1 hypothetical protein BG846_05129 [Streptomyces fradiae ATCC 10745 = DSM 40063]QEV12366.1 hypothetical protein CP974_10365 [Streptomyces fradiae ATCC 10745 = DSM 40063]
MLTKRLSVGVGLVAGIVMLGVAPASAYQYIALSGTGEARAYNNAAGSTSAYAGAWDSSLDGDAYNPVYNTYYRTASPDTERNLWNKTGAGTLTTSGSGSRLYKMRICESVPLQFDPCSGWKYM